MPEGMGYYSGVMDAMKTKSEMGERTQRGRLYQLQERKLQQELDDDAKTKAILGSAFNATMPQRIGDEEVSSDEELSNRYIQAGKDAIGTDPKVGLELIKQGQQFKSEAALKAYRNTQMKAAQVQAAGTIASQITDQDTLNEAIPELAKNGMVIPERFGNKWSPQLKEWLGHRAVASDNYLKSLAVENDTRAIDLREEENESKQADRVAKQKIAAAKEDRQRNKIESGRKLRTIPQKELLTEVAGLNEIGEFEDLNPGMKLQAANDVFALAQGYMNEDPDINQAVAMQRARQDIVGRIDVETGEYKGFGEEANTKKLASAKPASIQSKEEYDSLPVGAAYVNPKDGKVYKKKKK
jgi:hypothetical protein